MELHFRDPYLDLSHTEIMGTLDLDPTVHLSADEIVAAASDFAESGATFIEFSVGKFAPKPVPDEVVCKSRLELRSWLIRWRCGLRAPWRWQPRLIALFACSMTKT